MEETTIDGEENEKNDVAENEIQKDVQEEGKEEDLKVRNEGDDNKEEDRKVESELNMEYTSLEELTKVENEEVKKEKVQVLPTHPPTLTTQKPDISNISNPTPPPNSSPISPLEEMFTSPLLVVGEESESSSSESDVEKKEGEIESSEEDDEEGEEEDKGVLDLDVGGGDDMEVNWVLGEHDLLSFIDSVTIVSSDFMRSENPVEESDEEEDGEEIEDMMALRFWTDQQRMEQAEGSIGFCGVGGGKEETCTIS